jgi:hypothetical protein
MILYWAADAVRCFAETGTWSQLDLAVQPRADRAVPAPGGPAMERLAQSQYVNKALKRATRWMKVRQGGKRLRNHTAFDDHVPHEPRRTFPVSLDLVDVC